MGCKLTGYLTPVGTLVGSLAASGSLSGSLAYGITEVIIGTHYEGSYEFTPTGETQTVVCENMIMDHNVTINPIPSNYGLITWNGSVITVS